MLAAHNLSFAQAQDALGSAEAMGQALALGRQLRRPALPRLTQLAPAPPARSGDLVANQTASVFQQQWLHLLPARPPAPLVHATRLASQWLVPNGALLALAPEQSADHGRAVGVAALEDWQRWRLLVGATLVCAVAFYFLLASVVLGHDKLPFVEDLKCAQPACPPPLP